jgi:hypothetical protein
VTDGISIGAIVAAAGCALAYLGWLDRREAEQLERNSARRGLQTRYGSHGIWAGIWFLPLDRDDSSRAKAQLATATEPTSVLVALQEDSWTAALQIDAPELLDEEEARGWVAFVSAQLRDDAGMGLRQDSLAIVYALTSPPPSKLTRDTGLSYLGRSRPFQLVHCPSSAIATKPRFSPRPALFGVTGIALLLGGLTFACVDVVSAALSTKPRSATESDRGVPSTAGPTGSANLPHKLPSTKPNTQ